MHGTVENVTPADSKDFGEMRDLIAPMIGMDPEQLLDLVIVIKVRQEDGTGAYALGGAGNEYRQVSFLSDALDHITTALAYHVIDELLASEPGDDSEASEV